MLRRTWDGGKRCAECCNGDRCDDPSHFDRKDCPHCKGTGWALWTAEGLAEHHRRRDARKEEFAVLTEGN